MNDTSASHQIAAIGFEPEFVSPLFVRYEGVRGDRWAGMEHRPSQCNLMGLLRSGFGCTIWHQQLTDVLQFVWKRTKQFQPITSVRIKNLRVEGRIPNIDVGFEMNSTFCDLSRNSQSQHWNIYLNPIG